MSVYRVITAQQQGDEPIRKGQIAFPDGAFMECALGKGGLKPAGDKREGDGASPIGVWPVRKVLLRPDKASANGFSPPTSGIDWAWLRPDDGWCDAPGDRAYNRHVQLPYPASAEVLWRDDDVYDCILVLGHNDDPVVPGAGSAIFAHLARDQFAPTEGCVAMTPHAMARLLAQLAPGDAIEICAPGARM